MPLPATLLLALTLALSGCVSLDRSERRMLRELKSYGISPTSERVKHPLLAGVLNILPGFGNFYLASGTDQSEQWSWGLVNLLIWPASVLWSVPEAAIDANTINKKETAYYYRFDREGKKELARLKSGSPTAEGRETWGTTESSPWQTGSSTRDQVVESIRSHCVSKWQGKLQHQQSCIKRMRDGWQEVGNVITRYPPDSKEYRMMDSCWSQWFPQMDRVASCTNDRLSASHAHGSRRPVPATAIGR